MIAISLPKLEKTGLMKADLALYDIVINHGRVIDRSLDERLDIAIKDGKIAAISQRLPPYQAQQTLNAKNYLVCPGLIDLHVHVFEWVTNFGLPADEVGINAGVTTVVDQGSTSPLTFSKFKQEVAGRATTDVRCFPLVNHAFNPNLENASIGLANPQQVDPEPLIQLAQDNPQIVRGFKVHGESGSLSRWGMKGLQLARQVASVAGLPLYVHTGELFPVIEANRPPPEQVVERVLDYLQAGDILAHCYSGQPDGLMGTHRQSRASLKAAIAQGILLDLGHGINFSFDIARRMMEQGIFPHTISSDVHGDFDTVHNDAPLNYSLYGALSKLIALGWDLVEAIAAVTINPACVLRAENEIGTLQIGSRADLTIVEIVEGQWMFFDCLGQRLRAKQQLIPVWVVRAGKLIQPHRRLLRDLVLR